MDDALTEWEIRLGYFHTNWLRLYPPASEEAIAAAEMQLGLVLSPEYRAFLHRHNGGRILEINLRGVQLLGMKRIPKGMDLVVWNLSYRSYDWWPRNWLQLGSDGVGNYYVADIDQRDKRGEYPILYVDHEAIGRIGAATQYASSYFDFLSWVTNKMINMYDPQGKLWSLSMPE